MAVADVSSEQKAVQGCSSEKELSFAEPVCRNQGGIKAIETLSEGCQLTTTTALMARNANRKRESLFIEELVLFCERVGFAGF